MFWNEFSNINKNIPRSYCRRNSQFIKHILYEEHKLKKVRDQEILTTFENPMLKEQKQTEQICDELKKIKQEKFLEQKRTTLLHQNEHEIRELVQQLKRADIQKELIQQKAYKEQTIKEKLQARLESKEQFIEKLKQNKQLAVEKEKESARKKVALREDLLNQIREKEKYRELEKENIKKERASRKKFVENMQKDIEMEKQYDLKIKDMLKQERNEYLENVKLLKTQEKMHDPTDHIREEELRRQQLRIEQRKKILLARATISEHIGQQILELRTEKQKHDELLSELLIGERLAKDDARYKFNLEQQNQRAKSLQEDLQNSFLIRQEEILRRREQEKIMADEQLKMFMALERKDKDVKDQQLPKNVQYRQDLLNAIEYKNWQRQFEVSQNKIEHEKLLDIEKKRIQQIDMEKLRLLKEKSIDNLKFLPSKVISKEHRVLLGLTCK